MSRPLVAIGLAALLVAGAAHAAERPRALDATAVLSPRIALFGDTVTARVDVTLDRSRVDPDSVRVTADFSPWELVEEPERKRRDGETTTYLQTTFVLRCLSDPCVPRRGSGQLEFNPARVTYAGGSVEVRWPVLVVHSRIVSADFERRDALAEPWQADVISLPAVSYRIAPGFLFALLLGSGVLLALGGTVLAYRALPRRAPAPAPEPEEPPPPPLTVLEQALALLEDPARANGAAEQRRALELVAEELAERDAHLAQRARALAWSENVPAAEETSGLAARVRAALEEAVETDA